MSQVADELSHIEMNCIIIKFLGAEVYESFKTEKSTIYAAKGDIINKIREISRMPQGYDSMLVEHFKFHESWDLLMIVWSKYRDLETKEMPELMYQKYIHKKEFIAYSIAYSKIDIAYNQLYEAIKGVFVVE